MSVPEVVGISDLSLDKLADSSDILERMVHVEKNQLRFFGADLSSANKRVQRLASPVLAAESIPEFFIIQENVRVSF